MMLHRALPHRRHTLAMSCAHSLHQQMANLQHYPAKYIYQRLSRQLWPAATCFTRVLSRCDATFR